MGGGGSTLKATPPKINPKLAAAYESIGPDRVADAIFKALDANADGKLSQLELQGYLMSRDAWLKKEDVDPIFAALDVNGDNSLSRDELRECLASPCLLDEAAANKPSPTPLSANADRLMVNSTLDLVRRSGARRRPFFGTLLATSIEKRCRLAKGSTLR